MLFKFDMCRHNEKKNNRTILTITAHSTSAKYEFYSSSIQTEQKERKQKNIKRGQFLSKTLGKLKIQTDRSGKWGLCRFL
jgi:hypothetical protein